MGSRHDEQVETAPDGNPTGAGGIMASDQIRLSGTNLERAADHNQRVTLHAIRVNGPLTRIDLARITGLTPPAIANITKRLMADGLIEDAGQRRGGRGQPATRLVINRSACYAIGVNIDRDHITLVVVDFAGAVVAGITQDIAFPMPADVQALYRGSIRRLLDEAGVEPARLVGLGVAKPDDFGLVDLPGRPADFACWETADIADLFRGPFELPIFVENDAAAAAMGEQQLGHGQTCSSFFYILISSGLGGGLVVDGAYFRGANGRSGEIGFMLARREGQAPHPVQDLVSLSGVRRALGAVGLTEADLRGNPDDPRLASAMAAWVEGAAEELCDPLIAVNCLINPAAIFVGGRLPGRWVDALADRLNQLLQRRGAHVPALSLVQRAWLAEDAPAVGAAILPFSHFLLPAARVLWTADAQG